MNKDFAVFILTHGRPDSICTFNSLQKAGYTGKVYFIIDNEDTTATQYYKNFGKQNVIMFNKLEIAKTFDTFDNFNDRRTVVYARNACFKIAEELGIPYFIELDDDYTAFDYRLYLNEQAIVKPVKNLDVVFELLLKYYKSIDVKVIALAQGGDFIGGINNGKEIFRFSKRKVMNTFICSTERPFRFLGRINEDVNTYTCLQSKGNLFLTIQNVSITQKNTQKNKGGDDRCVSEYRNIYKKFLYCYVFSEFCENKNAKC